MADGKGGRGEATIEYSDPLFIVAALAVVYIGCWLLWTFAHEQISAIYVYVRYVEVSLFAYLGDLTGLLGFSHANNWLNEMCAPDGIAGVCQRDFKSVTWDQITDSTMVINGILLVILIYWCSKMFIVVRRTHPQLRFTKTHNLQTFVDESKEHYPHLCLFGEIDLIDQPLDHPIFGMSQTSRQFAFENKLISGWKLLSDGSYLPTLNRDAATEIFRSQLGKHWTKSTDLTPGETLLVAIAIPRVAATDPALSDEEFKKAMKDSNKMIGFCWAQFKVPSKEEKKKKKTKKDDYTWLTPQIDLSEPRQIILKYINYPNVSTLLFQHAFNRTIIFALFSQARRLGVLQPAEMRWLRFFDRPLWYALQTIGRQAGFAEAAGILSHYLYESKSKAALVEPQLDKAVNGLEMAMNSYKFLPADKERYERLLAASNAPTAKTDN